MMDVDYVLLWILFICMNWFIKSDIWKIVMDEKNMHVSFCIFPLLVKLVKGTVQQGVFFLRVTWRSISWIRADMVTDMVTDMVSLA